MPAYIYDMFYFGESPWHQLGTKIDTRPNTKEALKLANLDWEVYKEKMLLTISGKTIPTKYYATYRFDKNGEPVILGNVSERYEVVQNIDAFKPFDEVLLDSGYVYETAGSVQNGSKIWVLAKAPSTFSVGSLSDNSDDVVEKYILMFNSHDGSLGVILKPTNIRVVCFNTLMLALNETNTSEISLKHTTGVNEKFNNAVEMLKIAEGNLSLAAEMFSIMNEIYISREDAINYFETVMPSLKTRGLVRYSDSGRKLPDHQTKLFDLLINNFYNGSGNSGKTLWHAYNAITEFTDHQKKYRDWIKATCFGTANKTKLTAYTVAKTMAQDFIAN